MKLITLYQVRKDASGELMKDASGNYIFIPVYNEGHQIQAKKAQILINQHNERQSTAPSGPGKAMGSHNAVKQGFLAGKCVISTQNQADFVYLYYAKQSQSDSISKFHPSQRSGKRKKGAVRLRRGGPRRGSTHPRL